MSNRSTGATLEHLELFYGSVNNVEARVYARLECRGTTDYKLAGVIEGPSCEFSRTLPAKMVFGPCQAGEHLLTEALLPDPCFWSPDLPFLYRATLQLSRDGTHVAEAQRLIGLRPLSVTGRNMFYDSRRWVLRCVDRKVCESHDGPGDVNRWHSAAAAMSVDRIDDELAQAASMHGVLLIEKIGVEDHDPVANRLASLARWPAVAIVVVESPQELPADVGRHAPNILLAWRPSQSDDVAVPAWARACWVAEEWIREGAFSPNAVDLPILVERSGNRFADVQEARSACDRLQRDMAPLGDFAGYIVTA